MHYIAQQRIKHGGKFYKAGEPITLTEDERAELSAGAVTEAPKDDAAPVAAADTAEADTRLSDALAALSDDDFKQDGEIRAASLRTLNELLGVELTAEGVAVHLAAKGGE